MLKITKNPNTSIFNEISDEKMYLNYLCRDKKNQNERIPKIAFSLLSTIAP